MRWVEHFSEAVPDDLLKPTPPSEFELVPDGEFLESQCRESQCRETQASRELQLVLDPEFL
ncbi:MAG: hypothetical protein P8N76_25575 [Pirellulaceae bacterium]|nr:hypothetical protein [Pirellulaceae bacterium]